MEHCNIFIDIVIRDMASGKVKCKKCGKIVACDDCSREYDGIDREWYFDNDGDIILLK